MGDQLERAAQQDYDANKAAWQNESNAWMSNNGYDKKLESWDAAAKKIRNRNKGRTPGQILDTLTVKIKGLRKNLVAMTKQLKNMTKSAVNQTENGGKKAKELWKDAASMMEAQADKALAEAQTVVSNL